MTKKNILPWFTFVNLWVYAFQALNCFFFRRFVPFKAQNEKLRLKRLKMAELAARQSQSPTSAHQSPNTNPHHQSPSPTRPPSTSAFHIGPSTTASRALKFEDSSDNRPIHSPQPAVDVKTVAGDPLPHEITTSTLPITSSPRFASQVKSPFSREQLTSAYNRSNQSREMTSLSTTPSLGRRQVSWVYNFCECHR